MCWGEPRVTIRNGNVDIYKGRRTNGGRAHQVLGRMSQLWEWGATYRGRQVVSPGVGCLAENQKTTPLPKTTVVARGQEKHCRCPVLLASLCLEAHDRKEDRWGGSVPAWDFKVREATCARRTGVGGTGQEVSQEFCSGKYQFTETTGEGMGGRGGEGVGEGRAVPSVQR